MLLAGGSQKLRRDPSRKCRCKAVFQSQEWDLAGTDPELNTTNTGNDSEMKKEVEERIFAQNGQGSRLMGDVAGKPKPVC
jgi:hypothetical protein